MTTRKSSSKPRAAKPKAKPRVAAKAKASAPKAKKKTPKATPTVSVAPAPVAPEPVIEAPEPVTASVAAPIAAIADFVVDDDTELAVVQSDAELANLFIAEALDHLGTIEQKLLELDERPEDTSLLNDIFRPFHTVKGNASALGIVSVERVAHKVENLLDLARSGRIQVGETEVDLVLRAVDVLSLMINDVGQRLAGQPRKATGAEAVSLVQQVERLIAGQLEEGAAAAAAVMDTPEPVAVAAADEPAFEHDRRGATPSRRRDDVPMLAGTATAIKVDTRKLDNIVDVVGELIVVQSLIAQDPALSALVDGRLARNMAQLRRLTADLQRNSMALRMVPIRQAFQKVARVVRDQSRKAGKPIDLVITG